MQKSLKFKPRVFRRVGFNSILFNILVTCTFESLDTVQTRNILTGQAELLKVSHESVIISCILDLEGGKFFFNTVKEGDSVLFATEDEQVKNLFKAR